MGQLLWLAFSGGEIFLREDIVEIAKLFYKYNRPAIILFPTNGLLSAVINEKVEAILKDCKKSTIVVKLSLEGTEDIHDSIRGKGSFKRTLETYKILGKFLDRYPNFELGINTVFCAKNQDKMDELLGFVSMMDNITTHTVSLIRGAVTDENLKKIDMAKYRRTIDQMAENLKRKISSTYRFRGAKIKAAQDILQRTLIYNTMIYNKQIIPCYAGKLNLVLTESGHVYPCESFDMSLGNIRNYEYNINRLLADRHAGEIIKSIQDKRCYCSHECYLMTNILFNPRVYPALIKEYLKL